MSIFESISTAFSGIVGNKMRSILTMFGIIVGISSVIMIMSVGDGVKSAINDQFDSMGMDIVTLYTESEDDPIENTDFITNGDIEMLRGYKDITAISPVSSIYATDAIEILGKDETKDVNIMGVNNEFFTMTDTLKILHGRFLLLQDIENEAESVVIDEDFAREVFGNADCLGSKLKINVYGTSQTFTVVGVLKSSEGSMMGMMYNRPATIYAPNPLVQKLVFSREVIARVRIKVSDKTRMKEISDNVIRLMELGHDNKDKYTVSSNSDSMSQINLVVSIFTIFLTFVAGISLFVGGIGVMNIMLVSVTERTKEIGIRKSLGASENNIRFQFLIEAIVLTGVGGIIGMTMGYFLGTLLAYLATMAMGMAITAYISLSSILVVAGISTFIGIVFGVYPAIKASRLDPIEALRFE